MTILEHYLEQLKASNLIDEIVLAISEKPGNEIFTDFAIYILFFISFDVGC